MLFGPDHDLRMMAVARDITQRREADEAKKLLTQELRETRDAALKANKFKSIFLANMSHELRTPLNAIIGYTELVDEELEDCGLQELREDTQKIGQAGRHLLALVNDILDLSKIESDKIELEEETFYFLDLFDELNTVLYPLLQKNNNTFHIVNASSLQKITTDRMRLHQVLLNLLSNANKFTTEGEITLSLSQETTGGMDCYHLSVQDTGVGIASERLPYLFEPFSQADGSIWKRFGGTGLGLAISRKLCRLMGGDLFVKSEVEVGSIFTIVLPVYINETKSLIETGDIPSPYEPQKRSCPPPSDG